MREITDQTKIRNWISEHHIQDCFDTTDLEFQAYQYEKGEYLTTPGGPFQNILFLISGTIRIYGVRQDGSMSPVTQSSDNMLIGDLEYHDNGTSSFFTEARSTVICLSLSVNRYRPLLDRDLRFLHVLLASCSVKLRSFASFDTATHTVEERILMYMRNSSPYREIHGIENAVLNLRCSRRQLQRTLKKLCENGQIEKTGKGHYRLKDKSSEMISS